MNYRHSFHAGNFADIFKHIILVLLIQALLRKEKSFCYMDTHAGVGLYDLNSEASQKTLEYQNGIQLIQQAPHPPPAVKTFLNIVKEINQRENSNQLRFYPGSPRIARALLTPNDRMILSELHPVDSQELKKEFFKDPQVAVHQLTGYQSLKAFLPPTERRGLVLIDPPFEKIDEFDQLYDGVMMALKRWSTGIYALWYPIKNRIAVDRFLRRLKISIDKILVTELAISSEISTNSLKACGMAIINPPWQLEDELKQVISWLWQILSPDKQGGFIVENGSQ